MLQEIKRSGNNVRFAIKFVQSYVRTRNIYIGKPINKETQKYLLPSHIYPYICSTTNFLKRDKQYSYTGAQ